MKKELKTLKEIKEMSGYKELFKYFKWLILNYDCDLNQRPNKEALKKMMFDCNYSDPNG